MSEVEIIPPDEFQRARHWLQERWLRQETREHAWKWVPRSGDVSPEHTYAVDYAGVLSTWREAAKASGKYPYSFVSDNRTWAALMVAEHERNKRERAEAWFRPYESHVRAKVRRQVQDILSPRKSLRQMREELHAQWRSQMYEVELTRRDGIIRQIMRMRPEPMVPQGFFGLKCRHDIPRRYCPALTCKEWR